MVKRPEFVPLADRSVTPPPAVVDVKRTLVPLATAVDQSVSVPEELRLVVLLILFPAAIFENAAATFAAVTSPDAVTVTPATVKVWPEVIAENVTSAFSVTAALLLMSDAETPRLAVLIACTTVLGVGFVTVTAVVTPGLGP
tara:strand:- start:273 stop:698 length:426 start_codon:yes stop_codon:yes gene_type:complete